LKDKENQRLGQPKKFEDEIAGFEWKLSSNAWRISLEKLKASNVDKLIVSDRLYAMGKI